MEKRYYIAYGSNLKHQTDADEMSACEGNRNCSY